VPAFGWKTTLRADFAALSDAKRYSSVTTCLLDGTQSIFGFRTVKRNSESPLN
jgi:hypothetical protein